MKEVKTLYYYLDIKRGTTCASFYNLWLEDEKFSFYDQSFYLISAEEMEFDTKGLDLQLVQIEGLEAALEKEIADSQFRQTNIKGQIAQLQCLTQDTPSNFDWNDPLPGDDDIPF